MPDLLRCLQSAQSAFASFVPPGRHHLRQEFQALLGRLALPGYPERTSLLLLPLSTYRDKTSEQRFKDASAVTT